MIANLFFFPKVDGNWGQWNNWTECDKPCGVGFQNRSRVCDDPAPAHGGNDCNGTHTNETQMCNFNYCPGTCFNKSVSSPNKQHKYAKRDNHVPSLRQKFYRGGEMDNRQ